MTASIATTLAKHELTDVERQVVYDIFTIARYHSRECQANLKELREAEELEAGVDSDDFGNYLWAVGHLHAAIAPAAVALVPILAPLDRSDGARIALLDPGREKDLERFLRPIFEQAGLADDFTAKREETDA
jgi:hypothetical protein